MPLARARIVWVIVACLAWEYGVVNEARGVGRESLPVLLLVITSFAIGLGSLVVALSDRAQTWLDGWRLFGILTFLFVAFGFSDFVMRTKSPYVFTTDAHVYMDYAARVFLAGKNPYDTSLYGAMEMMRAPVELQTPLDNAGLSDRLAYPSLSLLYLVPFIKLGIPSTVAYALALYGCLAVLYKVAPRDLRPLVLVPFFADQTYLSFSFGGITDSVWALLLCLVVVTWRRPALAALFFGLACSYKQHPWLLAPFLMIRIAREVPRGQRLRVIGRFFGIVALVFAVLNVPFALWSPHVWLLGVVEPLASSMVPLGEGVSSLLVFAGAGVPKAFFTLAYWGLFALLLVVCATWRMGRVLMWVAPSIAFFLNYRSLSSYWYFNLLPFVAELASGREGDDAEPPPLFTVRWNIVRPALALAVLVLVAGGAIASSRSNGNLEVVVGGPYRTWNNQTFRIDLTLTNKGTANITPRFWVQGSTAQPLPWHSDGPPELAPGATGAYSISAVSWISRFDVGRGARLTIADLNSSLRKSIDIAGDDTALSPHAVPNGGLRFWDVNSGSPTFWIVSQKGSPGASAVPVKNDPHHAFTLSLEPDAGKRQRELVAFCMPVPSCYAGPGAAMRSLPSDLEATDHRVDISTDFALGAGKLFLWAHTPKDANVAPALDDRYGVELRIAGHRVMLLLGGEAGAGKLSDGTPYEVVPGPRETWARYAVDLGDLQRRFAPNVYPKSFAHWRFPLMDIPAIPVRLLLVYASRSPLAKSALFGEIESTHGKDRPEDVMAEMSAHPGAIDAWRAHYEAELKNPTRSRQYLARARRNETHPELELVAAFDALARLQTEEAEAIFAKLLPVVPFDANIGLGHVALQRGQGHLARPHFEAAIAEIDKATAGRQVSDGEETDRLGAMLGLADAQRLMGDCAGARQTFSFVPPAARESHLEKTKALPRCD